MLIDHSKINMMPLIMGPQFDRDQRPGIVYAETDTLLVQYRTEREAVRPLLPTCYDPASDPEVAVAFVDNRGVDYLAGHGYRLATVNVTARYAGEADKADGSYVLVMFENETLPIITGREHLGIHKMPADISPVRTLDDNHLRCEASFLGHLLFGIDVAPPLRSQNALVRREAARRLSKWPLLGYKYIPSLDGPPDADYPTILWTDYEIEQLWLGGSGEVYFGNPGEQDMGRLKPVVDALRSLPVLKVTMVSRSKGSSVIRYDKCGRLR